MLTDWKHADHATQPFATLAAIAARLTRIILVRRAMTAALVTVGLAIGLSSLIAHRPDGSAAWFGQIDAPADPGNGGATLIDELQAERDLTALSLSGDAKAAIALFRLYQRSDQRRGSADLAPIDRLRSAMMRHSLTWIDAIDGYSSVMLAVAYDVSHKAMARQAETWLGGAFAVLLMGILTVMIARGASLRGHAPPTGRTRSQGRSPPSRTSRRHA